MFEEYRSLSAKMYQITKPVAHSIEGDLEYYRKQLKDVDGDILEVGVGNGRFLIPLLEDGLKVSGIDISDPMLEYCQKNLAEYRLDAKIAHADIKDYGHDDFFSSIIVPSGTFCLFQQGQEILNNMYRILKKDGFLLLDILLPFDFTQGELYRTYFEVDDHQLLTFEGFSESIDWYQQTTTSINTYQLYQDDLLIKTEISKMTLYWYGIKEFEGMLKKCGFKDVESVVGYGKNEESTIITLKATK